MATGPQSMGEPPTKPLIISASRTKDMVHRAPDVLARLLLGELPCRWGPYAPSSFVDPAQVHTVVLWTKDPRNLLVHEELRAALLRLRKRYGIGISLQVTATGLGGSFVEPGIPPWQVVHRTLQALFDEGWLDPRAVVYRYDPFLSLGTPGGNVLRNDHIDAVSPLARAFLSLGIPRMTTSRGDGVRYRRVAERVGRLGLAWQQVSESRALTLCREMDSLCQRLEAEFSVCCEPPLHPSLARWGCIDARWLNRLRAGQREGASETPHNKIGKQRTICQCTYSRDIGYSTGSLTCFSGGFGCLYCYAQGNARIPDQTRMEEEIRAFDRNPRGYLTQRGLLEILAK